MDSDFDNSTTKEKGRNLFRDKKEKTVTTTKNDEPKTQQYIKELRSNPEGSEKLAMLERKMDEKLEEFRKDLEKKKEAMIEALYNKYVITTKSKEEEEFLLLEKEAEKLSKEKEKASKEDMKTKALQKLLDDL